MKKNSKKALFYAVLQNVRQLLFLFISLSSNDLIHVSY